MNTFKRQWIKKAESVGVEFAPLNQTWWQNEISHAGYDFKMRLNDRDFYLKLINLPDKKTACFIEAPNVLKLKTYSITGIGGSISDDSHAALQGLDGIDDDATRVCLFTTQPLSCEYEGLEADIGNALSSPKKIIVLTKDEFFEEIDRQAAKA